MPEFRLNPFVHFIEDHRVPTYVHYGIVHRLSSEVTKPGTAVRTLLRQLPSGATIAESDLIATGEPINKLRHLVAREFLILPDRDPLSSFMDHLVVRPIQNPALGYSLAADEVQIVRTSMQQFNFSPAPGEVPEIFEETLPRHAALMFLAADGSKTLREMFADMKKLHGASDEDLLTVLDFLTQPERQLIKLAPAGEQLDRPFSPCNAVPRSLAHSSKRESTDSQAQDLVDFHEQGISDADWEFDWIEPTLNHSYRFTSEALGGLNYASRFCRSTLTPALIPSLNNSQHLAVLEVGAGTGRFAASFCEEAKLLAPPVVLDYHIVDLSPALIANQQKQSGQFTHFQQDATRLDLSGRKFSLILSNEVIADFPTARVERATENGVVQWKGGGARYVEQYDLPVTDAPDVFQVNAGVFDFIERAWDHLLPGGVLLMTEYGGDSYPERQTHLNHDEYSIHFGHVMACASHVGYHGNLLTLKEFLAMDDEVLMLDGSAEQIFVLNYLLNKFELSMPYAAFSKREFQEQFGSLTNAIGLVGPTFSPLKTKFHYGPDVNQFKIAILKKT